MDYRAGATQRDCGTNNRHRDGHTAPMNPVRPQTRCARWLIFLVLLHTVPVVWVTPVAGGTAPTAALLAFGFASLATFEHEGVALALLALGPAVVYCAIAWLLAWLAGRLLERLGQPQRAIALAVLVAIPLASVYWPIYVAGGHNSSHKADLFGLFQGSVAHATLLGYWLTLHALLLALYVGHLLRDGNPVLEFAERWRRPATIGAAIALAGALLYGNYPTLLCRPLAEFGSGRAALCVARSDRRHAADWYARAAERDQIDAIAWMVERAANRDQRQHWLRRGAELGNAAMQFALYQDLQRSGNATEAAQWLQAAAESDDPRAQMVLVEMLSQTIYRAGSTEQLAARNRWLERAHALGDRGATLLLAQHRVDGSMGYAIDLAAARDYYVELRDVAQLSEYERMRSLDTAFYQARIAEIDRWQTGLAQHDAAVERELAERYLHSQFPGPGVRERGRQLLEELAAAGDSDARAELIVALRTGSNGFERDLDAAAVWLLRAAQSGDVAAMRRVAHDYASGQEGFAIDYPEARHWTETAIAALESDNSSNAATEVRALRNQLAYFDRLAEAAEGPLLGPQELQRLGERTDAESEYRYALQLLAGHGAPRRAEAIARFADASRQGHAAAAWRLVQIYERGLPTEIDTNAAAIQLERAAALHHFDATRELAMRYEQGTHGLKRDLGRAIAMYEAALAAGRDNRYGWNLDPNNFNHFKWLESRLRQARLAQDAATGS